MAELKKLDRIPTSDVEIKALLLPLIEAKEEYNNVVMENTQEAIRTGMTRTIAELKRQGLGKSIQGNMTFYLNGSLKAGAPIDFDEFSKDIALRLEQQTFIASEQTIDRMTHNVMDNLKDSYEAGYGIDKTADELKYAFDNMQGYELERVARTEVNGAQNRGAEATMLQLGIQYDMWRTAGDERVRGIEPGDIADHTYLDGQISKVGEPFSNGLTRPGDRGGRIEEWINCRCTLIPYLIPEGYAAPEMSFFYDTDLIKVDVVKPITKPEEIIRPEEPKIGMDMRRNLDDMQKKTSEEVKRYRIEVNKLRNQRAKVEAGKPKPGPNWDNPEYLKYEKEYARIFNEEVEWSSKIGQIQREIDKEFKKLVYVNKEGFKIDKVLSHEFDMKGLKNTNKGLREFSKLIDEKLWTDAMRKKGAFNIEKLPRGTIRAYYDNSRTIAVGARDSKRVIIHETAHYMEAKSPGLSKKVKAFYNYRTKDSPLEWLGPGYGPKEMTRKDRFIDAYMGKDYPKATEILSMGMEYMHNDPIRLATKDPEMFDFIFNILRGK